MYDLAHKPLVALSESGEFSFIPKMMNRHGLISGATGTGKTVTLQTIAETFSQMGVPVFAADIKGDLSGIGKAGGNKDSVSKRVDTYRLEEKGFSYQGFPVQFWDVFGEQGHPLRCTVSEMGPMLLERLLNLNDTQGAVLSLVFKIADENNLLLIDLKDLQKMLEYVGNNRKEFITKHGNISAASIGAIQRNLMRLDSEGAELFFGEPELDINDLLQTDQGKGIINIIAADKLMMSPRVYTSLLLWLLSNFYETLPEVGDLDKPKLVFFFDEAHLLFNDMPKMLLEKVEQIVRLIRSKGVGVYFITQNPSDIPDTILGQLGNRVQHALRAYTPKDQKAVRVAAQTFRTNPKYDTEQVITELGTGEGLISFLDEKGAPSVVERAYILPPQSQIGPIAPEERSQIIRRSLVYGIYEKVEDRVSAYEMLNERQNKAREEEARMEQEREAQKALIEKEKAERAQQRQGRSAGEDVFQDILSQIGKSASRQISSQLGRSISRSLLGTFFGKR
ncbi:MAG: helicase HerA-like domain-containing protein [Bacteroidales bacterium]